MKRKTAPKLGLGIHSAQVYLTLVLNGIEPEAAEGLARNFGKTFKGQNIDDLDMDMLRAWVESAKAPA